MKVNLNIHAKRKRLGSRFISFGVSIFDTLYTYRPLSHQAFLIKKIKIKRTKLQLPKVSTSDLLSHAEVWADHQHARRARAGRTRVCAAALSGLGVPHRPLALLLPRVLHGSGHRGSKRGP